MSRKSNILIAILAVILVQALFGVNFVSSKIVVTYLEPTTFASLRFLISGVTLYIFAAVEHRALFPKISSLKTWTLLVALSVFGIAISQTIFLWGLKHSTSTNTAVLSTSIPMFTMVISSMRGQSILSRREIAGFLISLIALLVFYDVRNVSFGSATFHGDLAILLSCGLMAAYISYCKDLFAEVRLLWGSTLLFLLGSVVLLPSAISNLYQIQEVPPEIFIYAFAYSVFCATLVTYFLNNWAYRYLSPAIISLFVYLQPVAAAIAAYEIWGTTMDARKILAAILIFLGMMISVSKTIFSRG